MIYSKRPNFRLIAAVARTQFQYDSVSLTSEVEEAVRVLRTGGVVAFPTDTLYGLGANVFDPSAIERLFAIKERPAGLALPVLIDDWRQLEMVAAGVPEEAAVLAERFWPGPLTLVLTKSAAVPDLLTAGAATIAVRMPDHPVPRAIAAALGSPITGTSANVSGRPDPESLEEVKDQLGGRLGFIVGCGPAPAGTASTIVDITSGAPKLLRTGAISLESIRAVME